MAGSFAQLETNKKKKNANNDVVVWFKPVGKHPEVMPKLVMWRQRGYHAAVLSLV